MKKILFSVLFIFYGTVSFLLRSGLAQESTPMVRLIYFRSNDSDVQQDIDAKVDILIKDVQQFFADEMEQHGFGRKTFQIETDTTGKAVVHHIIGHHNGKYYRDPRTHLGKILGEIREQVVASQDIYLAVLDAKSVLRIGSSASDKIAYVSSAGESFDPIIVSRVLGYAFGLESVWSPTYLMSAVHPGEKKKLSLCSAKFLDAIPHFNPNKIAINNQNTIIQRPMLSASPPHTIRLRFKVSDPDGLRHALLIIPTVEREYLTVIMGSCVTLQGQSTTAEFVTTGVSLRNNRVQLVVVDVLGNITECSFQVNITSILPSQIVEIPDEHLASAIKEVFGMHPNSTLTFHDMRDITILDIHNRRITDLKGLEHAVNMSKLYASGNSISDISPLLGLTELTELHLSDNGISDVSLFAELTQLRGLNLSSNPISDLSFLAGLTQLRELGLGNIDTLDISFLAGLTQLKELSFWRNGLSDVSFLTGLIELRYLWLFDNTISDVAPLVNLSQLRHLDILRNPVSYTSAYTHIPAIQAKGTRVSFDNRSYRALVKISGDTQEAEAGETLANPLVVQVVDAHGKPMPGMIVTFDVSQDGGTLRTTTATTSSEGKAQTTLRLGATPGANTVTVTAIGILSSVTFTANGTRPPMYWIDKNNGTLHRSMGATIENLVPSVQNATSLAVDVAGEKLYWTEKTSDRTGKIQRANLDGANVQLIKSLTSVPRAITIDTVNGKLYLTNSWGKIQRLNFDGSNFQTDLITDLSSPAEIILDVARNKLYWIEQTSDRTGKVQRANLDGSNVQLVKSLTSVPRGIAIDTVNRKLYLTNSWGKIQRLDFDGFGFEPDLVTGLDSLEGIALDVVGGKLYWIEADNIRCANLNGEDIQTLLAALNTPGDIALSVSMNMSPAAPANTSPTSYQMPVPDENNLLVNYPNPFNPETWIPYQLAEPAEVKLRIYSVSGALVRTLALGYQPAGMYHSKSRAAYWDGQNEQGERVASGIYFYTLSAGDFTATQKMLLMK